MTEWTNRYAVEGVLRDLGRGKHVLAVGAVFSEVESFAEQVEAAGRAPAWATICRTRGHRELVHRSGGRLRATSMQARGHRGWTADVIFAFSWRALDHDAQMSLLVLAQPFRDAGAELILPE